MKAVGVHVFAGGFTMGVKRVMPVECQLEIHGLGKDTVEQIIGIPFIQTNDWKRWPKLQTDFIFGNPRCTGFSTITSGYGDASHGDCARQNKDIWDLCRYGANVNAKIVAWESVQQAFSKGADLVKRLRRDVFKSRYNIAHILLDASWWGSSQSRRRYFFVAYHKNIKFNTISFPNEQRPTIMDVLNTVTVETLGPIKLDKNTAYLPGHHIDLTREEWDVVPHLPQDYCLNKFAHRHPDLLEKLSDKLYCTWLTRSSEMPFSMHTIVRPNPNKGCPTLSSTRSRLIHPTKNRPLTIAEFAALMCWPPGVYPIGPEPFAQLAKGICPPVGEWLAECVKASLNKEFRKGVENNAVITKET